MFEDYGFLPSNEGSAGIDMGPLIDMVFILLIFFIITTNFSRQTGIEVNKPKAQTAVSQGQKTLLVGISREGTLHLYGRQVSLDHLGVLVGEEVAKRPDVAVVIIADQDAVISRAVQVMDQCALAGAQKVSLAAEKE
jgi:biopolymer transport protein ExbD